jgi:hypothetical protein
VQYIKHQKSYALQTDVLPESRDIHCLVMNFGVHGLGELTLIQKKREAQVTFLFCCFFGSDMLVIISMLYR